MTLSASVSAHFGTFRLHAEIETAGRLVALFGPSGSGKSSLVNLIAGLARPDRGRITVDDRVLVDTTKGIDLPAYKRRVGYVFQDARLFPHLSVSQNLRFGRFFAPRAGRYADLARIVDLLGLSALLDRQPDRLSGGEKQRVAIGRALAASPRLMLMDEPLAALDDARKQEILPYIERLRDEVGIPIVYVSHSLAEVSRLATDVVLMADGQVTASGRAADVLSRLDILPESERGEGGALIDLSPTGQEEAFGISVFRSAAGEWRLPRTGSATPMQTIRVRVRARDVMIATRPPEGLSALNVFAGRIIAIEAAAPAETLVTMDCKGDRLLARVTQSSADRLALAVGLDVYAIVKAASIDAGSLPSASSSVPS